ncbi:uncharacterized protein KY384_007327 [Bacidia gigantensis]|uniref:uncharacterized protein n=1 Tax=Bacidia gigantensis TaxID=2732470 RepID=UPI001D05037D|nr:uncharacterized protein KY384_007327 [Bacidia gigantensis]KAG8528409.1 hypothetical protein KY384_007327 [Bacidia gigantensis]
MSGLEVFQAIAAVDGLVKGIDMVGIYVRDVWKYEEQQGEMRKTLDSMKDSLQSLYSRKAEMEAHAKKDILFSDFLKVVRSGALENIKENLDGLEKALKPRKSFKKALNHTIWTVYKRKINSLLSAIEQIASRIRNALQADHLSISLDTNQGMDESRAFFAAQKRKDEEKDLEKNRKVREQKSQDIVAWLPKLDFEARHQEILEQSIEMGHDIFKSTEFDSWRSNVRPWLLSCWADAGAGKTMLSTRIIEHLRTYQNEHHKGKKIPILCAYLNHKEQDKQSLSNILGSLLKQLILYTKPASCSDDLVKAYDAKWPSRFDEREMANAFRREILEFDRVMIVADALDESFDGSGYRFLEAMAALPMDKVSVLTTSRGDVPFTLRTKECDQCDRGPFSLYYSCQNCRPPIEVDICYDCKLKKRGCPNNLAHELKEPNDEVVLDIAPSNDNIKAYVKGELHKEATATRPGRVNSAPHLTRRTSTTRFGRLCEQDRKLEQDVIDTICDRADGKFMMAKLYVKTIKDQASIGEIRRALGKLPKGYSQTYQSTMERIQEESRAFKRATRILSWIVFAKRPLTMAELQHALATDVDDGYQQDEEYPRDTIVEDIAGLIYIGSDDTVRLDHYTLQEYFNGDGHHWLHAGFSTLITRVSLAYINVKAIYAPLGSSEDAELAKREKLYPFMSYANGYWGYHARTAETNEHETSDAEALQSAIIAFLQDDDRLSTFVKAFWYLETPESSRWEIRKGATALHLAAWFGLASILPALVKHIYVDSQDPGHRLTALMCASRRGHAATVTQLLALEASPNKKSARGRTAMYEAVTGDHLEIVKILLDDDVDLEQEFPWDFNRTILMVVAQLAKISIVDPLLEQKPNLNHRDTLGLTALSLACSLGQQGHIDIVEKLLGSDIDIDINATMANGGTALNAVAAYVPSENGRIIALILLEKGADPEHTSNRGETSLFRAAADGNLHVLEAILEERSELLHKIDGQGRTLLHASVSSGELEVAEYLVSREIKKEARDHDGRTALHEAARVGTKAFVEYLLSLDLDVKLEDKWSRTPAVIAWQNGQTDLLPLLAPSHKPNQALSSKHILDDATLPLWSLAKLGREDLITARLSFLSPTPSLIDFAPNPDTGDTPIHCAIASSQPSILKLLLSTTPYTALDNTAHPINARNFLARTPLHEAISTSSLPLLNLLLANDPQPDLNAIDIDGSTPLWLDFTPPISISACGIALLAAGATLENNAMITPYFFAAIQHGNLAAVESIIRNYAAAGGGLLQAKNAQGRSGLQVAKASGWGEIVRVLTVNKSLYYDSGVGEGGEVGEGLGSVSLRGPLSPPEDAFDDDEEEEEEEVGRGGRQEGERMEEGKGKGKGKGKVVSWPDVPATEPAGGLGLDLEGKVGRMALEET